MSGNIIITIGLAFIGLGTWLTIQGQAKNSEADTKSLKDQLSTQKSLIENLQEEANVLRNIGNSQLKATFYTEELTHEIRTINFRIRLKQEEEFSNLCPLKFAFEFNPHGETPLNFRSLVTDGGTTYSDNSNKLLLESYKINSISIDENNISQTTTIAKQTNRIHEILIPITVTNEMRKNIIKDFHDEQFCVYLPENLIDKVEFVELIVNGWGILRFDPKDYFWREEQSIVWTSIINRELKLKKPWSSDVNSDRKPHGVWKINIYDTIPIKYDSLASKNLTSSLQESLVFSMN